MKLHHIALIVSDEEKSVLFYRYFGFTVLSRTVRPDRNDTLLFLSDGNTVLELFVRSEAPARLSNPEAYGLRHLAFSCRDIDAFGRRLSDGGYEPEPVRQDRIEGRRFFFVRDPDGVPIEIREEI